MNKSYEELLRELDAAVTESAKLQQLVLNLSDSVRKRSTDITYKKALGYVNKAAWCGNELVYTVEVTTMWSAVRTWSWVIGPDSIHYKGFFLHNPNDEFLVNPPLDNSEAFQKFILETTDLARKVYRQYKGERNGRSASAHKA